jgi:AcrR family transcriptional regulator
MEISKNRVNPEIPPESGSPAPAAGRRYGGVDRDERQRQRRERLIIAALAVFGEQGFHASTVRDVCRRAELTSRYFYESFDSMEALFEALYLSVSRELMHRVMLVLQQTPMEPLQLSEAALRTFLEFLREDPRRAQVTLIDALNVGRGMHRISQESNRDFAAVIGNIINMFFPNIEKVGLDTNMIANGLVGSNVRIATQWVEDQCSTPLEDVLRNMMAFFAAAIHYVQHVLQVPDSTQP